MFTNMLICLNAGMGALGAGQKQIVAFFNQNFNGNFLLLEPIGGAAPKFSSDSKTLGNFDKKEGAQLALNCPAQAFPLPSFR